MLDPALAHLMFFYVVVLGACLGSFANVVIARLPHSQSLMRPRSRCPTCAQPIAWYDNLPIVSYLVLRGRCRGCRTGIPLRYLLVEVLGAGVAAALFVRFGLSADLALWLLLSTALIAIAFLDIDHWWVPDVITYPAMVLALAMAWAPGRLGPVAALVGLAPALLMLTVGWGFEKIAGKEGLGLGDVKLLALLGLALGIMDGFTVLLLAALQGALIGTLVIATGGHKSAAPPMPQDPDDDWTPHPHAVPFGPFLVLATFEVVLLPEIFATWHQQLVFMVSRWLG